MSYSKQDKKSIEMELLINSNSNTNSWEILLTIAIAIVPKMSIAIVISILLISSGTDRDFNNSTGQLMSEEERATWCSLYMSTNTRLGLVARSMEVDPGST